MNDDGSSNGDLIGEFVDQYGLNNWPALEARYLAVTREIEEFNLASGSVQRLDDLWAEFEEILQAIARYRATTLGQIKLKLEAAIAGMDEDPDFLGRKLIISALSDLMAADT